MRNKDWESREEECFPHVEGERNSKTQLHKEAWSFVWDYILLWLGGCEIGIVISSGKKGRPYLRGRSRDSQSKETNYLVINIECIACVGLLHHDDMR